MTRSRRTLSEEQVIALEAHLAGALRPVIPPIDVVQRLRSDRLGEIDRAVRGHLKHPQGRSVLVGQVVDERNFRARRRDDQ